MRLKLEKAPKTTWGNNTERQIPATEYSDSTALSSSARDTNQGATEPNTKPAQNKIFCHTTGTGSQMALHYNTVSTLTCCCRYGC